MKNTFRRFLLIAGALVVGAAALVARPTPAAADNDTISLLSSAARTADATSAEKINYTHRGVTLYVDIDSVTGTGTVDVKVQSKDPLSATWVDLPGASTGADGAGTTTLTIYPGVAETANVSVSDVLPKHWRVVATVVTGGTFSVAASYQD